jgi:excisionase family DNA binding protein
MNKVRILKQVNDGDYLTSEEAAKRLGIKSTAIRNYLYLGRFTTYKFKNLTLIDVKEVEKWRERQRG